MENPPSATRRVTRSQTLAALNSSNNDNVPTSRKIEDWEKGVTKSRQRTTKQPQDHSALIDITNDSPIVGLATGGLETPSSAMTKRRTIRSKINSTPGSGEALLRCQVKTLLQKVEEEAELSKVSLESRTLFHLQGFVNSPMSLLAPTPTNTPQDLSLSQDDGLVNNGLPSVNTSPVIQEQLISQVVNDIFEGKTQESIQSEKTVITRSLLLDFSEKSETVTPPECSSVVTTDQGKSDCKEKSHPDDDNSSVWSIQVHASSIHDEEEDEDEDGIVADEVEEYCDDNYEENEGGEYDEGLLNKLCEDMNRISVNNHKITAKFSGRHTRFLYDSDDEFIEERTEHNYNDSASAISPSLPCFKGLPTPQGKHLRFAMEEEETEA